MNHQWVYFEENDYNDKNRKCSHCKLAEIWIDEEEGWIWDSCDEEFIDNTISCCTETSFYTQVFYDHIKIKIYGAPTKTIKR